MNLVFCILSTNYSSLWSKHLFAHILIMFSSGQIPTILFNQLAYFKSKSAFCLIHTSITIISSKVTCSRQDVAEKNARFAFIHNHYLHEFKGNLDFAIYSPCQKHTCKIRFLQYYISEINQAFRNECRFSVRLLWHEDVNERIYKMAKNQINDIITYYLVVSFSHFIVEVQWKRVESSPVIHMLIPGNLFYCIIINSYININFLK